MGKKARTEDWTLEEATVGREAGFVRPEHFTGSGQADGVADKATEVDWWSD